jgi:hypothetical protein
MTSDPGIHLIVDGRPVWPRAIGGDVARFDVAAGAGSIRIASRSVVPAELGMTKDVRRLGVHVHRLVFRAPGVLVEIGASAAGLARGWHRPEGAARWTDGAAVVPPGLFRWIGQDFELALHVPPTTLRYPCAGLHALLLEADDGAALLLQACGFHVARHPIERPFDPSVESYLRARGGALDMIVLPRRAACRPDLAMLRDHAARAVILRPSGADAPALPPVAPLRTLPAPGFAARRGVAIPGAGADDPIGRFVATVLPLARVLIPELSLHAYDAGPDPSADRAALLDRHRILLAPMEDDATAESWLIGGLAGGIAAIVTPDLAERLGLAHEREVLVARDATARATAIARLEDDRALWERLAAAGPAWCAAHRSVARGRRILGEILLELGRPDLAERAAQQHG